MISASARRLSVFKSVVDLGGFNAAASRLGIAQPSVGAHVKALESQLGQPLFLRRRGSRPQLTRAGEAVYDFAVDVLRKAEQATHALADLKRAQAQEITIAVHRDLAAHFLPQRLTEFAGRHPRTRIVTRIGTIEEVIELTRARAADFALVLAAGPIPGLHSAVIGREPLDLVVARGHPLARRRNLTPAEVGRHPFVTGLSASRYFQLMERALRTIGIGEFAIAMELQESAAVKEVVRHGAGVACLPRCTVASELAAGTLVALRLDVRPPDLELRCAYFPPAPDHVAQLLAHIGVR